MLDFIVYSRDAEGTGALREDRELLEQHWSFMDAFGETMIARGPTFLEDGETATGSLHVLGLADVEAARAFVEREPNNRAGLYREHGLWRFENLLTRTMWEFPRATGEPMFFVLARSVAPPPSVAALPETLRSRLILYGTLGDLDDETREGVALAVQAPGREAVPVLCESVLAGLDVRDVEIHRWEFGGRR